MKNAAKRINILKREKEKRWKFIKYAIWLELNPIIQFKIYYFSSDYIDFHVINLALY